MELRLEFELLGKAIPVRLLELGAALTELFSAEFPGALNPRCFGLVQPSAAELSSEWDTFSAACDLLSQSGPDEFERCGRLEVFEEANRPPEGSIIHYLSDHVLRSMGVPPRLNGLPRPFRCSRNGGEFEWTEMSERQKTLGRWIAGLAESALAPAFRGVELACCGCSHLLVSTSRIGGGSAWEVNVHFGRDPLFDLTEFEAFIRLEIRDSRVHGVSVFAYYPTERKEPNSGQ